MKSKKSYKSPKVIPFGLDQDDMQLIKEFGKKYSVLNKKRTELLGKNKGNKRIADIDKIEDAIEKIEKEYASKLKIVAILVTQQGTIMAQYKKGESPVAVGRATDEQEVKGKLTGDWRQYLNEMRQSITNPFGNVYTPKIMDSDIKKIIEITGTFPKKEFDAVLKAYEQGYKAGDKFYKAMYAYVQKFKELV